jgi:hypothetical protein
MFVVMSLSALKAALPLLGTLLLHPPVVAAQEMKEQKFLDQVEQPGHVVVTARGVDAVNTEARRQGLRFPAIGCWSPETVCFSQPPQGDCNGVFRR